VANGAVYNLVADVDELILLVGSRTLARLHAALSDAERKGPAAPADLLVRIAVAYCDFAAENLELWRALFEHRMAPEKAIPDWAVGEQMALFRHIYRPLAALLPNRTSEQLSVTAASLSRRRFSSSRPRTSLRVRIGTGLRLLSVRLL